MGIIKKRKVLTREEETALFGILRDEKSTKEEKKRAEETLLLRNMGLVVKEARRFASNGSIPMEDLLQEGFFGLLKAAEAYDPAEGVAFMTYAWQWLRNAMFGSIRATGSAIRLPSHIQEKIWKYRRFISEYQKSTGSSPSDAQICAALSVDAAALAKIREALKAATLASIDAPVDDSDGSLTLGDSLAGAEDLEEDVGRRLDHEKMAGELQRLISRMDPEKQQALRVRFWGDRALTQRELLKNKLALDELRSPSNKARLRPYYESYLGDPYRGGLRRFRHTGESVVESLTLLRLEREEMRAQAQRLLDSSLNDNEGKE